MNRARQNASGEARQIRGIAGRRRADTPRFAFHAAHFTFHPNASYLTQDR